MGTRTITEWRGFGPYDSYGTSGVWNLTMAGSDVSASESRYDFPLPDLKFILAGPALKNIARIESNLYFYAKMPNGSYTQLGSTEAFYYWGTPDPEYGYNDWSPVTTGVEYTVQGALNQGQGSIIQSLPTNYIFNNASKTTRTIEIVAGIYELAYLGYDFSLYSSRKIHPNVQSEDSLTEFTGAWSRRTADREGIPVSEPLFESVGSVTLNAPPTFTCSEVTYSQSADERFQYTTVASITISKLSAKYSGYIVSAELQIGSQTVSTTSTGELSMRVNIAGTFTPKLIVTDSRGQTSTREFDEVTIKPYYCQVLNPITKRIDPSTHEVDDEGTNAILEAYFSFSENEGDYLIEPRVTIGNAIAAIAWYKNYDPLTGVISNPIVWETLTHQDFNTPFYGLMTDTFARDSSYEVLITAKSRISENAGVELPPADVIIYQSFYLLVGRAGGHGLGIGKKPVTDNLEIDMSSRFEKDICLDLVDYEKTNTEDYNLYQALLVKQWEDVFDTGGTKLLNIKRLLTKLLS